MPLKCKNYQKGRRIYSLSIVNAEALTFSSLELNAFLRDNMRFCNFKFAEEIGYSAIGKNTDELFKIRQQGENGVSHKMSRFRFFWLPGSMKDE